jgi:hypothetical protein
VHDVAPRIFDDLFEHIASRVPVGEPGGEHLPEWRALMHFLNLLDVDLVALHQLHDLVRDAHGQHPLFLQRPEPFENDGDRDHGARDDRPHEPTAGLDDLEH